LEELKEMSLSEKGLYRGRLEGENLHGKCQLLISAN